jgi:nitrogen fixation NifU-like protein
VEVGFTGPDDDLYREIILDHYRAPRNKRPVEPADCVVEASNPLCGDEIDLSVRIRDGAVEAIGFTGKGCSISQASASMMCEGVEGQPTSKAAELGRRFRALLMEENPDADGLGDLEALAGVKAYPVRIKCALLPWNALLEGITGSPAGDSEVAGDNEIVTRTAVGG